MLAVEQRRLQRQGVHPVHATEVHDVLPRPARRLAESGNAAELAEIVPRLLCAELVLAERAFLRFDLELLARHEMHHGSAFGAKRTVAAYAFGDRLGFKREFDSSAVATGLVGLHGHFSAFYSEGACSDRHKPLSTALDLPNNRGGDAGGIQSQSRLPHRAIHSARCKENGP